MRTHVVSDGIRKGAIVVLVYTALAIAVTWPLVRVMGSRIPHDLGDPLLSTWTLWWNAQRLPFSPAWWDAPQFYPIGGSISFSDHRVGIGLIAWPVLWAGGSPVAAHNLALLLSFALSAIAAHWLVFSLTRRHDAAFIAGLAFGFNPYRMAHIQHLELVSSYWMPIALLALHRYVTQPSKRWLIVFCAAWLLQSLCCGYYFFFFSVLVALWMVWFLPRAVSWKRALTLIGVWSLTAVLLLPVLLKYRQIHDALGLHRTFGEVALFSADATAILSAPPELAFWRSSSLFARHEGALFPGAVVLGLVIAGLVCSRARREPSSSWHHALVILAAGFGVVAACAAWLGAWQVSLGRLHLSVSRPRKPLSLALACLVLWCIAHPRVRSAFRRRSAFAFYVIATLLLWVLTWGPNPNAFGFPFLYQAPYAWLMRLPGFSSGLRVPARFAMPGVLALSIAAGLALARVLPAARSWKVRACAALLAIGVLADGWIRPPRMLDEPAMWTMPSPAPDFKAVLELPLTIGGESDAAAVYRGLYHRHPTVNGFSGYYPVHYLAMHRGLESGDETVLSTIAAWGPILIAIDRRNDADGRWAGYVTRHRLVEPLGSSGTWSLYLLHAAQPRPLDPSAELSVQQIASNFTNANWDVLVDGDPLTRWATHGAQHGGESVVVDLGAAKHVKGVRLSLGAFDMEYPKALAIETSPDGDRWTVAWTGPTAGLAVAAAVADPRSMTMDLPFDAAVDRVRYVRLRQTGRDDQFAWSLADIAVLGS